MSREVNRPEVEHCCNVISAFTELIISEWSVDEFKKWCNKNTSSSIEEHCLTLYYKLFTK